MEQNNQNSMVLIVDDTPKNIQVIGSILMEQKYRISVAKNGREALKVVKDVKPDIILLDIMMPELDGFETCKQLKESPETRDIPVIFLTAKIETEDIVKAFELGAVDYVIKPFNPKEL
ncbi:MAG: response regulator, partial [Bacteroidales bacterium]|nr:response regulator [Bacteroidales bacterium]